MEAWWLFSRTGRTYFYAFRLYLPKDFPQTTERLVLAQWCQLCEARRCRPDRPVLAICYEEGRLQVTRQNQDEKVVLYQGTARRAENRTLPRSDPPTRSHFAMVEDEGDVVRGDTWIPLSKGSRSGFETHRVRLSVS